MDEHTHARPDEPATGPTDRRAGDAEVEHPEFGPSGYLPQRAAQRARKIILRAPLGIQWVVASLVAGVVVVAAGVAFLVGAGGAPSEPFEPAASLAELTPAAVSDVGDGVLLVRGAGRVRAFADADGVTYCAASNRLEAGDGRVWSLTGRGQGGTASLAEHPSQVHDEVVYVDPTSRVPGPAPTDEVAEPGCD